MKQTLVKLSALVAILAVFPACTTNNQGQLRPIDPIGRALFNALDPEDEVDYVIDPAPRYTVYEQRPGRDYVWVEGAYGRDARGRRVWVPGHWAPSHR